MDISKYIGNRFLFNRPDNDADDQYIYIDDFNEMNINGRIYVIIIASHFEMIINDGIPHRLIIEYDKIKYPDHDEFVSIKNMLEDQNFSPGEEPVIRSNTMIVSSHISTI